jgi:uncharacterized protein YqgC (DUF456 family)
MEALRIAAIVLGYVVFYVAMLAGMVLIPLGIPGEFITVAAVLVFTLVAGSGVLPWWVFLVVLGLGVLAELLEAAIGFLGPKKARGSIWSCFGAVGGGLAGAVAGSMVGLLLGALLGAFVGTFLGAFAVEYALTKRGRAATDVALAAVAARVVGSVTKVSIAFVMIALVTVALLT